MTRLVGPAIAAGLLVLASCSSSEPSGPTTAVVGTDTTCTVAQTQLTAGKHAFTFENKGTQVAEVYIYGTGDKVVTEKEDVGPGTKARFSADLKPGDYQVACKPGQKGSGIRERITVT